MTSRICWQTSARRWDRWGTDEDAAEFVRSDVDSQARHYEIEKSNTRTPLLRRLEN